MLHGMCALEDHSDAVGLDSCVPRRGLEFGITGWEVFRV